MSAGRPGRTRHGWPNRDTTSISSTPLRAWWKRRGSEVRSWRHRSRRCRLPMLDDFRRRTARPRPSWSWDRCTISRRRRIGSRHLAGLSVSSRGMALPWWRPSRATPRPWTAWRGSSPGSSIRGDPRSRSRRWPASKHTDHPDYFTTAYFHRPEDLRSELEIAGFREVGVLGVEGPGWMLQDFDARWED